MSKLDELKAKADELGVKYHHMAGEQKIQDAIDAHLAEHSEEAGPHINKNQVDPDTGKIVPMTAVEYKKARSQDDRKRVGRLLRCRITCMNPNKREWEGEIISVGSRNHGTFKKFIPFDGREYHIPQILYDELKGRKCTVFSNAKDPRGRTIRKARLIDEFAIEVLPPLTRKELDELRKQQALAEGQAVA